MKHDEKQAGNNLPQEPVPELTRLRRENEEVAQQVKRLIKAESKLYVYQEELDAQLKEYKDLYGLGRKISATFDILKVFEYAVEYIIHNLGYERVVFFEQFEYTGKYAVCALDGYYDQEGKKRVAELVIKEDDPFLSPLAEGGEHLVCTADPGKKELVEYRSKLLMHEYVVYPLCSHKRPHAFLAVGNSAGNAEFYRRINEGEGALLGLGNLVGLLVSAVENHIYNSNMQAAFEQERVAKAKFRGIFENAAEGILQTAPDGRFLSCNPAAAAILGYASPEELIGSVPSIERLYVSPQRRKELYELMHDRGEVKNFELELNRKDGGKRWVLISARPSLNETGELIHVDGIIQDITERKRAEEENLSHLVFTESLEWIDLVIRQAGSIDGLLTDVLDTALSIFESDRAWLLYPCDPDSPSWRVPMERTRPEYPGALARGTDIPMTPELREVFLATMNSDGPLVFDPRSGRPVPQEVIRQYDVRSQIVTAIYPKTGKPWLFGMHQCSYARVWREKDVRLFKEIGRRLADGLSSLLFLRNLQEAHDELETRVKERTAELSASNALLHKRHMEASVLYKVSSVISRSIGFDKLIEEVLETISGLELFNVDKGGIFIVEGDRMKLVAHVGHSDAFLALHRNMKVGDCLCGLVAKTGEILISRNSEKDLRHTIVDPYAPAHGHLIVPLRTKDRVEGVMDLYMPADAEMDEDKVKLLSVIGQQMGIAIENARLYEKTKALSLRDPLTGLWNHEEILRILGQELARAEREGASVGVIMADLDHFKKVNDTYGHMAGDAVLRLTADRLVSKLRSFDAVGRYGGEEFLIVLPRCDDMGIGTIAERLRSGIAVESMNTQEGVIPVTLSLGCAIKDQDRKWDVNSLVRAADAALYRAKKNGRNRMEIASTALSARKPEQRAACTPERAVDPVPHG